jgi:hypothetical protein
MSERTVGPGAGNARTTGTLQDHFGTFDRLPVSVRHNAVDDAWGIGWDVYADSTWMNLRRVVDSIVVSEQVEIRNGEIAALASGSHS